MQTAKPYPAVINDQNDPDFDGVFDGNEDLSKEIPLHNKYAFWCLKRVKSTVFCS